MIDFLNENAGTVTALATVALLLVTGWYAYTTWALLHEVACPHWVIRFQC